MRRGPPTSGWPDRREQARPRCSSAPASSPRSPPPGSSGSAQPGCRSTTPARSTRCSPWPAASACSGSGLQVVVGRLPSRTTVPPAVSLAVGAVVGLLVAVGMPVGGWYAACVGAADGRDHDGDDVRRRPPRPAAAAGRMGAARRGRPGRGDRPAGRDRAVARPVRTSAHRRAGGHRDRRGRCCRHGAAAWRRTSTPAARRSPSCRALRRRRGDPVRAVGPDGAGLRRRPAAPARRRGGRLLAWPPRSPGRRSSWRCCSPSWPCRR